MSFFTNNNVNSAGALPGGLFGSGTTNNNTNVPGSNPFGKPQTVGLFGATTSTNPSNTASPSTPAGGGGVFGGVGGMGGTSSLFGAPSSTISPLSGGNAASNTPAPAANTLFSGSAFTPPKPGDTNSTVKPPNSFLVSPATSDTATTTTAPSTSALGGGLFGLPSKPADASTTPALGGGLFGAKLLETSTPVAVSNTSTSSAPGPGLPSGGLFGGSLFGKPAAPAPTSTSINAVPGGSGLLYGNSATTPAGSTLPAVGPFGEKPGEKKDGTATSLPVGGGLFGAKPEEKKDGAPVGQSLGLFGAPTKEAEKDKSVTSVSLTSQSTTAAVAVPPPSILKGNTIEEIVSRWTNDLETQIKEFSKFAGEVAVWDRALIENGRNLGAIFSHVQVAEREQNDIDQSLDHIERQQQELCTTLDAYEKITQEILGGQGGSIRALDTGPADTERDKNYMLATDLHTHLDDISGSLSQMIESVNGLSLQSAAKESSQDPLSQITQILNTHLESLQWIDGAVREVEGKVTDVEKRVKESGHATSVSLGKSRSFGLGRS